MVIVAMAAAADMAGAVIMVFFMLMLSPMVVVALGVMGGFCRLRGEEALKQKAYGILIGAKRSLSVADQRKLASRFLFRGLDSSVNFLINLKQRLAIARSVVAMGKGFGGWSEEED
jgi:hypothetical protein